MYEIYGAEKSKIVEAKSGKVLNQYAYDIWGNPSTNTVSMEQMNNPFRYAGEPFDPETGMYYLRARYYDPTVGRFISEDTYKGQVDNPLTLNRYTYVHNNPLRFVDPSGNAAAEQGSVGGAPMGPGAAGANAQGVSGVGGGKSISTPKPSSSTSAKAKPNNENAVKTRANVSTSSRDLSVELLRAEQNSINTLSKSRNKPKEYGIPNTTEIVRDSNGKITKYVTYGSDGKIIKEVRTTGKDHGEIPSPNVKEPKYNSNPKTGEIFQNGYQVRPARSDEIPRNIPE